MLLIISFHSLISCFSFAFLLYRLLSWELRLLIRDFSSFLLYMCRAINLLSITALAVSQSIAVPVTAIFANSKEKTIFHPVFNKRLALIWRQKCGSSLPFGWKVTEELHFNHLGFPNLVLKGGILRPKSFVKCLMIYNICLILKDFSHLDILKLYSICLALCKNINLKWIIDINIKYKL